jgi:Tol biopolymer transport system component
MWDSGMAAGSEDICGVLQQREHRMKQMTLIVLLALVVAAALIIAPAMAAVSGEKIAFVSNRDGIDNIYVMNADGTNPIRLTSNGGNYPAWSPDGSRLVFSSNRDNALADEIYVMNADGTNPTRLTNNAVVDTWPAWSPDGSRIVYSSGDWDNVEIYVMNADGTNPTRLTDNPDYGNFEPAWSPDGSRIAFTSGWLPGLWGEIYVMNADGTNPIRLTDNSFRNRLPEWSPDGTRIAFTSFRNEKLQVFMMNADGTDQTSLTDITANDWMQAWSPDGSRLVFSSDRDGDYEIYVMNADGTGKTRLTVNTFQDQYPAWSSVVITNVPTKVKIVPKTINLGSNGYFLAFVTLPEAYKGATIDMKTVSCSGAPAVRMMKLKIFPRIVGFVFKTSKLNGVGLGKTVSLTVQGELKNKGTKYSFTGSDDVSVISKPGWQLNDIKDVSKLTDDQLFKI